MDHCSHWSRHTPEGAALEADWNAKFAEYEKKYADNAATLNSLITVEFLTGWADALSVRITYLCTILQLVLMCGGLYSNG